MTHDIDDLLEMIKKLEERIIALERGGGRLVAGRSSAPSSPLFHDSWYWEHG